MALELERLRPDESWIHPLGCRTAGRPEAEEEEDGAPSPLPPGGSIGVSDRRARPVDYEKPISHLPAADPSLAGLALPDGMPPVAVLRRGAEVTVVALPNEPDEGWGLDYLLLRSPDGGRSWTPPVASGVAIRAPFEVLAGSRRHRATGDEIELHAVLFSRHPSVADLDSGARVVLTLPAGEMTRDRDGDGLSNVDEAAIGLAPDRADSDGDGVDDAHDRLSVPGSPGYASREVEAILALAVGHAFDTFRKEPGRSVELPADDPIPASATRWIAGAEMPLSALETHLRVVLLDDAGARRIRELDEAVLEVTLLAIDSVGDRAVVAWRDRWAPGAWAPDSRGRLYLERDDERGWHGVDLVSGGGCVTLHVGLVPQEPGDGSE